MANESETLLLSDQVTIDRKPAELTLSSSGILCWKTMAGDRCLHIESDVLGFGLEGSQITVRAFVENAGCFCCNAPRSDRVRKDFVFEMPNEESKRIWYSKLREFVNGLGRPRKLFIVVNPFGGNKSAVKIFQNEVHSLLVAADIQYTLQETQFQLHAKAIAHSLDLFQYDGLVCISGDGVLVEVLNGLLSRPDWEAAIKMPLGIVPAGTGNGMVKSLMDSTNDSCSPSSAILAIIRGHKRSLDVATILQEGTRFFSILLLSWGLLADVDIESEKCRWMGSFRLDFYALVRILWLRKYHGCIFFVPAPGFEAFGEPVNLSDGVSRNLCVWQQNQETNACFQQCGYQGTVGEFEDSDWRMIRGPFISVCLQNVPWASENAKSAPKAEFSDGYLDLIVMTDCPKPSLLELVSNLRDGSHIKSSYVKYLKVKALYLEPGYQTGDPSRGGIVDSDGEVLARGEGTYKCGKGGLMAYGPPIKICAEKGLATLFSPK